MTEPATRRPVAAAGPAATAGPAHTLEVAERRLVRLGLDLHDGAVQDVAALVADVAFIRRELEAIVPPAAAESLGDVEGRLRGVHEELRDLAHSLEARALVERPLTEVLANEAAAFRSRADVDLDVELRGDLGDLTASQRIAAARIVQEALSNVREHSGADRARVEVRADDETVLVRVWDDGRGFSGPAAGSDERRGLGLAGIYERVRLLNGSVELDTRPGGPTTVTARLPRWRPPAATAPPPPAR